MEDNNPFDRALEVRRIPKLVKDSAITVTDTLDLAWASAKAVFEDKATPEHAITIASLILQYTGHPPGE